MNQGRSPKQQETNYQMAFTSLCGLFICLIYIILTQ